MRKLHVLIILSLGLFLPVQTSAEDMSAMCMSEQAFLVYKRYYYIARLSKTIEMLAKMYFEVNNMQTVLAGRLVDFKELLPYDECQLLQHKIVRRSVQCIQKSRNLKPLFMVWDSFKAYKFLEDELLIDDFSKEIFIITRNTLNHLSSLDGLPPETTQINRYVTREKMLDTILSMTGQIEQLLNHGSVLVSKADFNDLNVIITSDAIATRFYHIKRVAPTVAYLLKMSDQQICARIYHQFFAMSDKSVYEDARSLEQWWSDIRQYKHLNTDEVLHDFLCYLILVSYSHAPYMHKNSSQEHMHAIYQQIEKLPIEELLTTLDALVVNFYHMHQDYKQSGLPFATWIKQYWWVPPLLISSVLLKVFKHYFFFVSKQAG